MGTSKVSIYDVIDIYAQDNHIPPDLVQHLFGALRAKDNVWLKSITDELASPQKYSDAAVYKRYSRLTALISKYELFTAQDAELKAIEKLSGVFSRMRNTNASFENRGFDLRTYKVLNRASAFLRKNLRFPSYEKLLTLSQEFARHGPGSTIDHPARRATQIRKFGSAVLSGGNLALELARNDEELNLILPRTHFRLANYNEGLFVPKNMHILRGIAKGPTLNVYYQLGLGEYIKRRLSGIGIDITDQTHNQVRALRASITGELATVDISSASDSIALSLVRYLFQHETGLLKVLMGLREPYMYLKGSVIELPILSSMGNGFTFPMETAIFFALAHGMCQYLGIDPDVSAYGDDIILPTVCYEPFIEVLNDLGIQANFDKSFGSGPFRESCGADYWKGEDVRPLFFKKTDPLSLYAFCNLAYRRPDYQGVRKYIAQNLHHAGPPHEGQNGYVWEDDDSTWTMKWDKDYQAPVFRRAMEVPVDSRPPRFSAKEYYGKPEALAKAKAAWRRKYGDLNKISGWSAELEECAYLLHLWRGPIGEFDEPLSDNIRGRVNFCSSWTSLHG